MKLVNRMAKIDNTKASLGTQIDVVKSKTKQKLGYKDMF